MKTARSSAALSAAILVVLAAADCSGGARSTLDSATQTAELGTSAAGQSTGTVAKEAGDTDGAYASWLAAMERRQTYKFSIDAEYFVDGVDGSEAGFRDTEKSVGFVDARGGGPAISYEKTYSVAGEPRIEKVIIVDNRAYVNFGDETDNKYSVEIDVSDGADASPADRQILAALVDEIDVCTQLANRREAVVSVQKKGDSVTIDGVTAQPYEVTFDVAPNEVTGDPADAPERSTQVRTYYVGPDELPRRVTYSEPGMTWTADYTNWGTEAIIVAPPKPQIIDREEKRP